MLTSEAMSILRKASDKFTFGKWDDGSDEATNLFELSVWHNGRFVGYLEHQEMPEHGDCDPRDPGSFDSVREVLGHYGRPFTEEDKKAGRSVYYRKTWTACFKQIMQSVPTRLAQKILRALEKHGYARAC